MAALAIGDFRARRDARPTEDRALDGEPFRLIGLRRDLEVDSLAIIPSIVSRPMLVNPATNHQPMPHYLSQTRLGIPTGHGHMLEVSAGRIMSVSVLAVA
jgi:hypothetical protein